MKSTVSYLTAIGEAAGSPVDFTFELPLAFTGGTDKVTCDLK